MNADKSIPSEFWIDVGGTFTDCIALSPEGGTRVHKLLSSGVYKGRVGRGSSAEAIVDPGRSADPPGYFEGFLLRVEGESSTVASFDPARGRIELETPLGRNPSPGAVYELQAPEEAPVAGMRWLLGIPPGEAIGPVCVRLGTTRGTNALLERKGAPTAFVTTRGFGDVLRIAYQNRPRLFDLHVKKPEALYREVVEIDARIDAAGNVLEALDEEAVKSALASLRAEGIQSLAVCLMNAYKNGAHEEAVGRIAGGMGFRHVSLSSALVPLPKIVSRGDTTVVDAYLSPIIREYISSIRRRAPKARIRLMNSAGALTDADRFVGKDSIFSGPAGGVVGCAKVASFAGFSRAIGFDMGGTSTDVSRFDGDFERKYEIEMSDPDEGVGVRVMAPMLAIETVAAGGGSICGFDGQKPVVGPESAGADPGPACYGRGGPLTVTDVNLILGRIHPDNFTIPLDRAASQKALDAVADRIEEKTGVRYSPETLAEGFVRIANANMASPIKKISLARGIDVRDYVLVAFGGAGGQHAAGVARQLGIRNVLIPPLDGVLSAFGIGMADIAHFGERHIGKILSAKALKDLEALFLALEERLTAEVKREGVTHDRILTPRRYLDLRYAGQDASLTVTKPANDAWREAFEDMHHTCFGFTFPKREVEIVAARVEVIGETETIAPETRDARPGRPAPRRHVSFFHGGSAVEVALFHRDALEPGDVVDGPAVILESIGTVVVDPGFRAEVTQRRDLLLTDLAGAPERERLGTAVDPITLELFNNHFASIAEQMGTLLQRTALSVNVKERLDFSCALFDAGGDLVVNAPHIPVHLGAMSECVKALMEDVPDMQPGDVFVTNDPYRGGSHLPDVTVITPFFDEGASPTAPRTPDILFFAASRAHHAEIGGIAPGSMPPFSTNLGEEGVVIQHFRLVRGGESREADLRALLLKGPHPSRAPEENIADIHAAGAANRLGVRLLSEMVQRVGLETVQAYMGHIRTAARRKMRDALLLFAPGTYRFEDSLDDGSPVAVRVEIRHGTYDGAPGGEAVADFTGTGPVLQGNLNANPAIVSSAVLYCFRTLIGEAIPLNGGILEPVRIVLPECLLHPSPDPDPARSPAVAGGNVETSQRIVDALFGALKVVAAGQGTMNNVTFGNERFGYYETIGGGAGAGEGFPGADAVHVHMTNTRLTDPEILEARFPVRLRAFRIRRGSGGAGRAPGGDGIHREIEFLEPVQLSLLTQRRTIAPYGLHGGEPGAPGRNLFIPKGGEMEVLPSVCGRHAGEGDVLIIETPGGGGWGTPPAQA
ncbi:MAG: hydantoinase B/oxoprolinase family protein [Planctomycetota bacterium]